MSYHKKYIDKYVTKSWKCDNYILNKTCLCAWSKDEKREKWRVRNYEYKREEKMK